MSVEARRHCLGTHTPRYVIACALLFAACDPSEDDEHPKGGGGIDCGGDGGLSGGGSAGRAGDGGQAGDHRGGKPGTAGAPGEAGSDGTAGDGGLGGAAGAGGSPSEPPTCDGEPVELSVSARARATTVTLTIAGGDDDAAGYDIYRAMGDGPLAFVRRAGAPRFEDDHLALDQTVSYEVRQVDAEGVVQGRGCVTTQTLASAEGLVRVPRLDVLFPLYTSGATPIAPEEVARIKAALELARLFYYRNSLGRLHLDFTYMEIPTQVPSTAGPTMANVEADLRARGVMDNQYDLVFPVDDDVGACFGGFVLLGQTAGAFGFVCNNEFPTNDLGVYQPIIWSFVHEAQHAVDFIIAPTSGFDMIHGHTNEVFFPGYAGPVLDAAESFDWARINFRNFQGYDTLGAPYNGYIEAEDVDEDRFADDDPRLAGDEARFGSLPSTADSDGDGLGDLAEFYAGTYEGSNPLISDTDTDGLVDSEDPSPLVPVPLTLPHCEVVIDGVRDAGYVLYRSGTTFTGVPGFEPETWLCWCDKGLNAYIEMNMPATPYITIDGSGLNGYWQGGDTFGFALRPNQPDPFLVFDSRRELTPGEVLTQGEVVTTLVGSTTIIEAKIPAQVGFQGYGLTGETESDFPTGAETVLGLNVVFSELVAPNPFEPPRSHQNEMWHLDDIVLSD